MIIHDVYARLFFTFFEIFFQ